LVSGVFPERVLLSPLLKLYWFSAGSVRRFSGYSGTTLFRVSKKIPVNPEE